MNNFNLKQRVFMENEIIKTRNEIGKKASEYFEQYLNEKIVKKDESLIKKIKDDNDFKQIMNSDNYTVKPLKNGYATLTIYTNHKFNNLMINVKICFNGGKYEDKTYYCTYLNEVIYLGETEDNVLKRLDTIKPYQLIDYNEQKKLIEGYNEQKEKLKKIENHINHRLQDFKE